MDAYQLIIGIESFILFCLIILFFVYKKGIDKQLSENASLSDQINNKKKNLEAIKSEVDSLKTELTNTKLEHEENTSAIKQSREKRKTIEEQLKKYEELITKAKKQYNNLDTKTKDLQKLQAQSDKLTSELDLSKESLSKIQADIEAKTNESIEAKKTLNEIMTRIDLYSRLDELVTYGHYEEPEYLYETSTRFTEEIKRIRAAQKQMISDKQAVICNQPVSITSNEKTDTQIINGQIKLLLSSFNIDCDSLIGKVKPSTFPKTLEQIEKLAANLEKSTATLHLGFNTEYIKLKYEECKLQYQFKLKKQEEQDEQRLINEQMREEIKARKEYEKAIAEAEKEELMYRKMLEKAKKALQEATDDERLIAQQRIEDLEAQLAEALAKEERAKSMAQQTRKGHVYVISNIGSFGENVYKIGLTRRLDPLDRVKELGDASVPFKFDVHAIIHSDDAPALESTLHREFKFNRVNAVNYRKEFFNVSLDEIREAAVRIAGKDIDFKMTALAEEYYETRRLQREVPIN